MLYSCCKNFEGREIFQVLIPTGLGEKVMTMAHDAVMSVHQSQKKTKDRIWREFWWPGFGADVTRFCRSCDISQRTKEELPVCRWERCQLLIHRLLQVQAVVTRAQVRRTISQLSRGKLLKP